MSIKPNMAINCWLWKYIAFMTYASNIRAGNRHQLYIFVCCMIWYLELFGITCIWNISLKNWNIKCILDANNLNLLPLRTQSSQMPNVTQMTVAELKAANSAYLNNWFTWSSITRKTAPEVREKLVEECPDDFWWNDW
jgi:hypothetical protein